MILTGNEIRKNVELGRIHISDFNCKNINPNSYDLTLGDKLLVYCNEILDTQEENKYKYIKIPETGYVLKQGDFYLGHSVEIVGSDFYVPILHSKSGIARLGLFIHITADLIDIGSIGNLTFQLHPTLNIKVYPNMRIGQVSFWEVSGEIKLYNGKYTNSKGPIPSKSFLDYEK